jgi:hypothetical protein
MQMPLMWDVGDVGNRTRYIFGYSAYSCHKGRLILINADAPLPRIVA